MGSVTLSDIPDGAFVLLDSAPIIYVVERNPTFAPKFRPLFEAQHVGRLRFAITTIAFAEVLVGPLRAGDEALEQRYRSVLESWRVVPLDSEIADSSARLRANYRLRLPDAIQAASSLAIGAAALVTHDRDFSRVDSLRVIS